MPIPSFRSCVPQDPSIAYGAGTGIVIDPYLPQSNSFSAYSQIPVAVDNTVFIDVAKAAPTTSFFTKIGIAANQTDAFVTAYLQDNYPKVISTKTVEQSSIQQIPNPDFDIVTEAAFFIPNLSYFIPFCAPNRIPQKKEKISKRITFAKISSDYDHSKIKTEEFAEGF
ncbi:MAG: hypothetical protein RLZZ628_2936 [Bacteroidota bacterium]|jgi:hypothetical protein